MPRIASENGLSRGGCLSVESAKETIETALVVAGSVGFAFGTGIYLFAWMVRQPYRMFRKITGSDVAS